MKIFPKTFLGTLVILVALILMVHGMVYVLMNRTYAAEKHKVAEKNIRELTGKIEGKTADEIRQICEKFALSKNVNLNLKIDGKVQHLQGFSGADIVTDELLSSESVPLVNNEQLGSILVSNLKTKDAEAKEVLVQMLSNVESLKEAREATLKILPFSLMSSIVVALIFSYFYSRLIVRPIKEIANTTEQMQEMKEVKCVSSRSDEIGELAEDINKLYANLRQTIERLEEEKSQISRLEREKVDLFRGASHELKTPLSSLHIMLENMLLGTVAKADYSKKLEEAILVVEKMSKMIEEILNTSGAEKRKLEKIEFSRLVYEAISEYELLAKTRELKFETKIAKIEVRTDVATMRKVLSNLISNAVKYAERGSTVCVRCERGRFSIWNQGEEIAAEDISVLFDPFYRRDNGVEGNGMGLYLVKNILTGLGLKYRFFAYKGGMKFEIWF